MEMLMLRRINALRGGLCVLIIIALAALTQSCSKGVEKTADTQADTDSIVVPVDDHADNDIAMNIRSIIDAINVDQPLKEADYNYTGILTDGSGRPLYTDVQGAPGVWEIKVLSPTSAVISNLYLGDLLPDDLVQYILTTNDIEDAPMMDVSDGKGKDEDNLTIYKTGNCDLIVENQTAEAPNGSEGPLLKIILRKSEVTPIEMK